MKERPSAAVVGNDPCQQTAPPLVVVGAGSPPSLGFCEPSPFSDAGSSILASSSMLLPFGVLRGQGVDLMSMGL